MWHEARKQERKIRGMLVDYRRRAERRRDFYEKIKADPTQFLQLHGRSYKIHLDPAVAASAESAATMMAWQGQADVMIDRFDARAHLDFIPLYNNKNEVAELSAEERQCNYERYRVLVQNSFLGISEEKFLRQLHLEEQYGYTADLDSSKKKKGTGAAIGFNYEEKDNQPQPIYKEEQAVESDSSDIDVDVDLSIDVSKIEMSQAHELNKCGQGFGMSGNDFYSFLTNDMEEAENLRAAKEEEEERALFSGRRSRRARRAHHEKRMSNRTLSPPSYAAKMSPVLERRSSRSTSKSLSPVNTGQITYITSFGGDDVETSSPPKKMSYAEKVKAGSSGYGFSKRRSNSPRKSRSSFSRDRRYVSGSRSKSRSRSRSRSWKKNEDRKYKRRSRSRSASLSTRKRRNRRRSSSSRSSTENRRSRSKSQSQKKSINSSLSSHSSKSKSRSRSKSGSSNSKSKSRSASPVLDTVPPKPLPRYYGRRKTNDSSSDMEYLSEEDDKSPKDAAIKTSEMKQTGFVNSKTGAASKPGGINMKPQDRLKKKMQILLNKQYKADKKAQQLRNEKLEQEARDRDEQMRELALKMRRRQMELKQYDESSNSSKSESETGEGEKIQSSTNHNRDGTPNRHVSPPPRSRRSRTPRRRVRDDSPDRRSRTYSRTYERSRDYDRRDYRDRDYDYRRSRNSIEDKPSSRAYRDDSHRGEHSRYRDSRDYYYGSSRDSEYRSNRHSKDLDSRHEGTSYTSKPLVDY